MERFNFDCSTKNIPIPTNKEYLKRLIEMTEELTTTLIDPQHLNTARHMALTQRKHNHKYLSSMNLKLR